MLLAVIRGGGGMAQRKPNNFKEFYSFCKTLKQPDLSTRAKMKAVGVTNLNFIVEKINISLNLSI